MHENERNRQPNAGAASGETARPYSGSGSTLGGQRHDEDTNAEDMWSRRQRYGAFYTNATQRSQQRQPTQSRHGTAREYERGGWNEGGMGSRMHGYAQGPEGFGFGVRAQGQTTHTPRFGGQGYRGREQRFPEARDAAEFDRGAHGYEDRYQSERSEADEERFAGRSGREWGSGQGYESSTSGREYGRTGRGELGSAQYARGGYGRGEFDRDDSHLWPRDYGGARETIERRRGRWQREALIAREIMTADVKAVTPDSSLIDVARIMKAEDTGIVPVVDAERRLKGLITDRDIVLRTLAEGKNPMETRAGDVMTDDIDGATPDEPVRDVIDLMGSKQVRRVPVVDKDDRLLGIISLGDIAKRADYDEDLQEALEEISSKRSFWSRLWS